MRQGLCQKSWLADESSSRCTMSDSIVLMATTARYMLMLTVEYTGSPKNDHMVQHIIPKDSIHYAQLKGAAVYLIKRLRRGNFNLKLILPQLQWQQVRIAVTGSTCAALSDIAGHALHASTVQACAVHSSLVTAARHGC